MKRKLALVLAVTLAIASIVSLGLNARLVPNSDIIANPVMTNELSDGGQSLQYHAEVTVSKNGEIISRSHNLLTDIGKDHIKALLANGLNETQGGVKWVAVGNNASVGAGDTTLDGEITSCGLSRASGTYTSVGTGNWTIEEVFSVTCSVANINNTALFNQSADGTLFAGNSFTDTNVGNGDSLNISWNIYVT